MTNYKKLKLRTEARSKDPETAVKSNFGTLIVLLSGIVLYADKIVDYLDIQVDPIPYYGNLDVFLWTIGNTVSPLLLCVGYFFKPKHWALAAPGAAYSIQMTYIFRDVEWIGRDYFWWYTAVFFFSILFIIFIFDYLVKNYRRTMKSVEYYTSKIRLVMDRLLDGRSLAMNQKEYTEKIIKPTIKDLNE